MVHLRDSDTKEIIASFETAEEAIEYADEHDLTPVYIDMKDIVKDLMN